VITTRRGFASLSQFQIMLWTFVIMASAVYVIALSGDLIPITSGTLVLLGISGTAVVIAKAKSESDATTAPPPLDPAAAAAQVARAEDNARQARRIADLAFGKAKGEAELAAKEAEAKAEVAKAKAEAAEANAMAAKARAALATVAPADKAKAETDAQAAEALAESKRKAADIAAANAAVLTRIRHPLWSDLIMEEVEGRELDVTRVQMLFFTLVTAVFVAMKVMTSYEIPDIPEGFLILMGISNSVYVGAKFATNPAAKS
jgi:flagellar biosynthesis GTPase FlhF